MKKTSLIILIVVLIILSGAYGFALWKTKDVQAKAANLEAEVEQNNLLLNQSSKKSSILEQETIQNLQKLNTYFIKQGEEFALIQEIENDCRDSNTICKINPIDDVVREEGLPSGFQILHITVDASGSFNDINQLTSILENLPYRSNILTLQLQSTGGNTSQVIFDAGSSTSLPKSKNLGGWSAHYDLNITTAPSN